MIYPVNAKRKCVTSLSLIICHGWVVTGLLRPAELITEALVNPIRPYKLPLKHVQSYMI